jgi:hypothetical protein
MTRAGVEMIFWGVGIVGALVSTFFAVYNLRISIRRGRAGAARDLVKDIHDHPKASAAVRMLDLHDRECRFRIDDQQVVVKGGDVQSALAERGQDPREIFIWESFDWFFYYVDQIEHHIRSKLIRFEDVERVFKPYADEMKKEHYRTFMAARPYDLVQEFWQRYSSGARPKSTSLL